MCITIGLFSAILSLGENCDFSHLLGSSCPIDCLSSGSDLAWGIWNTNSEYWHLSRERHLAINLLWRDYQIQP